MRSSSHHPPSRRRRRAPRAFRAARDLGSGPTPRAPAQAARKAAARRPESRGTRARSRSQPLPLGIEEGTQPDARRLEPAVDADLEPRVLLRQPRRHPREPDRLRELRTPARARDTTCRPPVDHDLAALERDDAVLHLEADEPFAITLLVDLRERPLPDEVVLVELDDPGHVRAQRVGLRIGVLPDDDVLLFEPEDPLCFETERLRAKIGAALEQRVPEVLGADAREVELVAELADESDPERQ